MDQTYAQRKLASRAGRGGKAAVSQPALDALRAGTAKPTREQMGRRVDLPEAMRSKMENAFGADLSAVKLYESQAVAEAGAGAITQGSNIAFAPGLLDFTSYSGQALLGHELSHVVSQQRGEVRGGGFLNDRALEARADREGAMAAAGQTVAAPAGALSTASAAPSAGPMQAKWKWHRKKKNVPAPAPSDDADDGAAPAAPAPAPVAPYQVLDPKQAGKVNLDKNLAELSRQPISARQEADGLDEMMLREFDGPNYQLNAIRNSLTDNDGVTYTGLVPSRMIPELKGMMGQGYSNQQIMSMFQDLLAPQRSDLDLTNADAVKAARQRFASGISQLKDIQLAHYKRVQATVGKLGSQMHPEDFIRLVGPSYSEYLHPTQDTSQLLDEDKGHKYTDPANDPRDRELADLHDYYIRISNRDASYVATKGQMEDMGDASAQTPEDVGKLPLRIFQQSIAHPLNDPDYDPARVSRITGPSLSPKEEKAYRKDLQKRAAAAHKRDAKINARRQKDDKRRSLSLMLFGKFLNKL